MGHIQQVSKKENTDALMKNMFAVTDMINEMSKLICNFGDIAADMCLANAYTVSETRQESEDREYAARGSKNDLEWTQLKIRKYAAQVSIACANIEKRIRGEVVYYRDNNGEEDVIDDTLWSSLVDTSTERARNDLRTYTYIHPPITEAQNSCAAYDSSVSRFRSLLDTLNTKKDELGFPLLELPQEPHLAELVVEIAKRNEDIYLSRGTPCLRLRS